MALELKDFGAFLDIEITDETTTDQVKDAFNSKYVTTENHSKALGEVNGILTSAIKKEAKGIDLEFKPEDIKDKTTKELISIFAVNAKAKFTQYETDKGSTNEQLEEKYKGDIDKYKGQLVERKLCLLICKVFTKHIRLEWFKKSEQVKFKVSWVSQFLH